MPGGHKADPGEHDPPGQLLPYGVHHLAVFQLPHEADGHTGDDLHHAKCHGSDEDHQGIIQGREQSR